MLEQNKNGTPKGMEWISLIYLTFFVLAVMTPSLVARAHFGIPEQHLEEIIIFLMGLGGIVTFIAYERTVERRMAERAVAVQSAERAMKELVESYRYIGSVNRQIDVLKKHMNQTSIQLTGARGYWKDLLQSLAANAATSANAKRVLIRFVELEKLRTDREIYHYLSEAKPIKVANRDLKQIHDQLQPYALLTSESKEEILVVPSDHRDSSIRAYILLAVEPSEVNQPDVSLIKVFANQAEMIYHQLVQNKNGSDTPLSKVEEVASMSVGEIS
jgi:hypothetical protein